MARHIARNSIKPRNTFERVAWLFMRYSGLVLVFLALSPLLKKWAHAKETV